MSEKRTRILVMIMTMAVGLATQAWGASGSWKTDGNGAWAATNNWAGGIMADGAGQTGWFTNKLTGPRIVTIDNTNRTLGVLNVGDANTSAAFTIAASGGAALIFATNEAVAQLNQTASSFGDTISAPLALAGPLDIANASPLKTLTISGPVTSTVAVVRTLSNVGAGAAGVTINGVIGANVSVVQNSDSSVLSLSSANTFTGGLFIKSGIVHGVAGYPAAFGTGLITLGDIAGSANATLRGGYLGTYTNPIVVASNNTGAAGITDNANSAFSGLVTLHTHDLTLFPSNYNLTLSGGLAGRGNLLLNATGAGLITLSTAPVNMAGAISNQGPGSATATISGGVGSNVTAVTEASTNSALSLITLPLEVNTNGTTLANLNPAGAKVLTVSGGVRGIGDLLLKNNSAVSNGITIMTTAVTNRGWIVNSGTGSGNTLISAVIGTNVTGVVQNSEPSLLTLGGVNTFTGGLFIKSGTVSGITSASAFGAPANLITIGDTAGSADATLRGAVATTFANPIVVASNNTGVATLTATAADTFSGPVTLHSHDLTVAASATALTLSGGMTGTGNLVLSAGGAGAITLSAAPVNMSGTITNSGAGSALVTISGGVGSNVTAITEASGSSALTLSGYLAAASGGTILANNNDSGSSLLTVAGGVAGVGDLVLNNNSAITNGITIMTAAVTNRGWVINSGTGSGSTLITATLTTNVIGVIQSSASSMLVLGVSNAYTRGTTVDSGTLRVTNTTGSGTGPGPVVINGGGSLQGQGTIWGTVTNNAAGTLSPGLDGSAGGTLTVGSLIWKGGGVFKCEVASLTNNGAGAGADYDLLVVTNALTAVPGGSNLIIRLDSLGQTLAFETNRNYSLKVITYGTASFNPADVTLDTNAFLAGGTWFVTNWNKAIYVACLGATSPNKNYWRGTGNWSTAANWSLGHAPLPGEDAEFDFIGFAPCTADAVSNNLGSLTLAAGYTGTVTFLTKYPGSGSFTTVTITGDCTIAGGTLTHLPNSGNTVESDRLALSVGGNLTVGAAGTINVDAKGFDQFKGPSPGGNTSSSSGASHGGLGSLGTAQTACGPTCGSVYSPTNLGSGAYGRGGGAVMLTVAGSVTVNGTISARGTPAAYSGAAGGSILIQAPTMDGTGVVDVSGAWGGATGVGSGGGGRIAVILSSGTTFGDISYKAYGGGGGLCPGGAGTVYQQAPGQASGEGILIVDNGNLTPFNPLGACTLINDCNLNTLAAVIIRNRGILGINTNTTLDFSVANIQGAGASTITNWRTAAAAPASAAIALRGTNFVSFPNPFVISNYSLCLDVPVSMSGDWVVASNGSLSHSGNYNPVPGSEEYRLRLELTGNLTVEAGGAIEVNSKGYFGEKGPGGAIQGQSVRGASHGGRGGTAVNGANTNSSLNCYGRVLAPATLGSGGGRYTTGDWPGRAGAGSIDLNIHGTTTVHGVISARPSQGAIARWAGAAGGSIYLRTRWLEGEGDLDARGDASGNDNNGVGGGGRVAVILSDSDSFGDVTMSAAGMAVATALRSSSAGTLYRERASESGGRGTLVIDNAAIATTNTVTQIPAPAYATAGELTSVKLVVTNKAQVELTSNLTMRDLNLSANSTLYLKGYTLTLNSTYHPDWGSTNWVVYEGGQIVWLTARGTLIQIR